MDLEATLADLAPRLLRYCLGFAADRRSAEDAAQEALTALVSRWRRHGPPESAAAFAFTVARRRANRARFRQLLLEPLERLRHGHCPKPGPEELALRRDQMRRTRDALERLPRGHREALLLVAAGDFDTAGAARVLALSGCRVQWGDGVIRFLSSAASARRSDLDLAGAELAAALEAAVALPVFTPLGPPEIDLAEELRDSGPIDLELRGATWMEILKAICESAECRFQMHYGLPGRLEVLPADPRLDHAVTFDGSETTLGAAAAELAAVHGLAARLGPDLDPAAVVRLPSETMGWKKALYLVCRSVICSGKIDGGELVLTSRVEPLATHPTSETEGVDLAVRFLSPQGKAVAGEVRFSWTKGLHTMTAEGDPWFLQLSWIPFGLDFHVVLPVLGRCQDEVLAEVDVLELVRLPLTAPRILRRGDSVVELGVLQPNEGTVSRSRPADVCLRSTAGRVEASLDQRPGEAAAATSFVAPLPDRLGAYLLITPPGVGPVPLAAVVTLGTDPAGRSRLALVRPRTDGSGADVELLDLDLDTELREILHAPDGRQFDLELRITAP